MIASRWAAVVLTTPRDQRDVVAISAKVSHRWLASVDGVPMLARAVALLQGLGVQAPIVVSSDSDEAVQQALARDIRAVKTVAIAANPAASALAAAQFLKHFPLLILPAEKALLTQRMILDFQYEAMQTGADFVVGTVDASRLMARYPDFKHQTVKAGSDHFAFCNVFAVMTAKGLRMLDRWSSSDEDGYDAKLLASIFAVRAKLGVFSRSGLDAALKQLSATIDCSVEAVQMSSVDAALGLSSAAEMALGAHVLARRRDRA